ncbi:complex I NDUFA9 subunit family protein [Acidiferrobacter sp.]|uniref:complex I NDUFA9 subunit family protein n=1 Tax=Acidiferrobacter sp. TaxID=1872107 RepID=UPI002638C8F4|nr:complex I NDUFA9 subunit family protein [Acidiferrobacter sp.]
MGVRPGALVVVLGGCGFLGRALARDLHRRGYQLRLVTRHPDRHRDLLVLPRLTVWGGDVQDEGFLRSTMSGAAAAVNLVGILHERAPGDFVRVHEELPERMARAGCGLRLLQVSAAGAHAASESRYLRSKGRGEQRLRAVAPDAVIVRPSLIYGPNDHFVSRFQRLLRWAPLGLPVPLAQGLIAPVHVDDVAAGITAALARTVAAGRDYGFCGPAVMSLGEVVAAIARLSGRPRPHGLSAQTSLWLARLLDHWPTAPFSVDQWRTLRAGSVCPADTPGLPDLGVTPRAFDTALADLISGPPLTRGRDCETEGRSGHVAAP